VTRLKRVLPPANFQLRSDFQPMGDQPKAIEQLVGNLTDGIKNQTLLGVTGSGKTFTIAHVIGKIQRPTLVIAPNKTLAAQLYSEFKNLFPENRVKYFVSYYDYYQPEAYVPSTNTYIEKDAAINEEIDKMRHSATKSLLETRDVIIVASVSCIYGIGAPEEYLNMMLLLQRGEKITREAVIKKLVQMQYSRTDLEFVRGTFRVAGEVVDIFPSDEDARALRLVFFGSEIEEIREIDSITSRTLRTLTTCAIYPTSHHVTSNVAILEGIRRIRAELKERLAELTRLGKAQEAERLEQRTLYDAELLQEVGFCPGIENYSRHLAGRAAGEPPATLIDYFPDDFLLVIDESHVTLSQLGGMYRGDRARKTTLVDFGFRLPSAVDNRPLNFEEFLGKAGQTIFVSATPGDQELEMSGGLVVEQLIRPTGLLDPEVIIRPATNQVDDLLAEIRQVIGRGERVLVTTLTKKMSEDLSQYLRDIGVKSRYLHSDVETIERVEILKGLRRGDFDVLIGINLLREGLDLPEVSLVAILDADKEGFLRSKRSLIQTMGRAARNAGGRAILYADVLTQSIQAAVRETQRRRKLQEEYNQAHDITPRTVQRVIDEGLGQSSVLENEVIIGTQKFEIPADRREQQKMVEDLRRQMFDAAAKREFERAAEIRDMLNAVQEKLLA
jgi:excinuclease ABC subunit B